MNRGTKFALGSLIGIGLFVPWWSTHRTVWPGLAALRFDWIGLAVAALLASLALQWIRTCVLLEPQRWRSLGSAVGLSHGLNVLAPSLVGDAFEVAALSRILNEPSRFILTRLVFRFMTTIAALAVLAGMAIGVLHPSLGFVVVSTALLVPFGIDALTPRWSPLLAIPGTAAVGPIAAVGAGATIRHTVLSVIQHALSAASIFILGAALDDPISPGLAAGMLALADVATYLPVPLGGVGIHHWSLSGVAEWMGSTPTTLVVANHTLIVLVGGVCALAGWIYLPDKSSLNGQNR